MTKAEWLIVGIVALFLIPRAVFTAIEPVLISRLGPAVSTTTVHSVLPDGAFAATARGRATKYRDCTFVSVNWYLGDETTGTKVRVDFLEPSRDRDEGQFDWGPWRIHMLPTDIPRSTAYTLHQCPVWWRQWLQRQTVLVKSPFYEGAAHE